MALAGAVHIAHFTEMSRASIAGPYDLSLVEGSITTPDDARAHPRGAPHVAHPRHHRRLRHGRRHPRAAELRRRRCVRRRRLRTPRVHRHARHVDPDRRTRPGGLRAPRLPDRPRTSCSRSSRHCWPGDAPSSPATACARSARPVATVCVLVDKGVPCLGPVTRAGCGALCPARGPWVLRLLRPRGDGQHAFALDPPRLARDGTGGRVAPVPHLQRGRPGVPSGEPGQ